MRTGLARWVSLATAAGVLAVVAGLGALRARGDESGAQEKSAAAKGTPGEKKPAHAQAEDRGVPALRGPDRAPRR